MDKKNVNAYIAVWQKWYDEGNQPPDRETVLKALEALTGQRVTRVRETLAHDLEDGTVATSLSMIWWDINFNGARMGDYSIVDNFLSGLLYQFSNLLRGYTRESMIVGTRTVSVATYLTPSRETRQIAATKGIMLPVGPINLREQPKPTMKFFLDQWVDKTVFELEALEKQGASIPQINLAYQKLGARWKASQAAKKKTRNILVAKSRNNQASAMI